MSQVVSISCLVRQWISLEAHAGDAEQMRLAGVVISLMSLVLLAVLVWQQAQLAARDHRINELEQALRAYQHLAENFAQWQEDHYQTERELRARQRAEAAAAKQQPTPSAP